MAAAQVLHLPIALQGGVRQFGEQPSRKLRALNVTSTSFLYLAICIYLYFYAPEGCPHGTHTTGTAYTRGTYSRVHTQTHTNT